MTHERFSRDLRVTDRWVYVRACVWMTKTLSFEYKRAGSPKTAYLTEVKQITGKIFSGHNVCERVRPTRDPRVNTWTIQYETYNNRTMATAVATLSVKVTRFGRLKRNVKGQTRVIVPEVCVRATGPGTWDRNELVDNSTVRRVSRWNGGWLSDVSFAFRVTMATVTALGGGGFIVKAENPHRCPQ